MRPNKKKNALQSETESIKPLSVRTKFLSSFTVITFMAISQKQKSCPANLRLKVETYVRFIVYDILSKVYIYRLMNDTLFLENNSYS